MKRVMGRFEWTLLVTLAVLWGGSFFFAEVALRELKPLTVVFCRVGIAAGTLLLLLTVTGQRIPAKASLWTAFFMMGALNNLIPFSLIVWGQTQITSGLASILNATTPLFTVVLAHFWTSDEKMSPNRLSGVLIGLAGVAVMIGPEALGGVGLQVLAQAAVLAAALCYALAGIFGRRFKSESPLVVATGQVTASTLLIMPLALVMEQPWMLPPPSAITWGALAGLAVLSTAFAYVIYFRLLATAGATNLLLVTLLIPVGAVWLGVVILGEQLAAAQISGMTLIGLGLVAIDGRLLAVVRGRSRASDRR